MPLVFSMTGSKERQVYGLHAQEPLNVSGRFTIGGPQPVGGKGGCPEWVAELFDQHPDIQKVALSGDDFGVVYQRMPHSPVIDNC